MDKIDYLIPKYYLSEIDSFLCLVKIQYFENYYDPIFQQHYCGYKYSHFYIEPYKCIPHENGGITSKAPSFNENTLEVPSSIAELFINLLHQKQEVIHWSLGDIKTVNEPTGYYIYPLIEPNKCQPRPLHIYKNLSNSYPRISVNNNRTDGLYECIEFGRSLEMSIFNTNDINNYASPISENDYIEIRNKTLNATLELYSILAHYYAKKILK